MSKICIYFESYYVGGLDTFVCQLINNWDKNDSLTLLCNHSHSGAKLFEQRISNPNAKVIIHKMPMVYDFVEVFGRLGKIALIHKFLMFIGYLFFIPYYILTAYKRLKLNKYDSLISINGGYPACVSSRCINISWYLRTRKRSIHNFHNFAVKSSLFTKPFDNFLDKLLNKSVSYFVSVSKICAESLRIRENFRNNTNITYIYNGIGDDIVTPTFKLHSKLGIDCGKKILIMLATYEKRKGHKFILDVFKKACSTLSDVHLLFIGYGTGEDMKRVSSYVSQLGLDDHVSLLDFQSNAMEYLAQSDILLIGSQSFESFGLTAIEAMKYKKLVLSTNSGGLKEVVEDGKGGYVFDIGDVKGMSDKIVYYLTHDKEMQEQGERGYLRFQFEFRVDRMVKEYKELLLMGDV